VKLESVTRRQSVHSYFHHWHWRMTMFLTGDSMLSCWVRNTVVTVLYQAQCPSCHPTNSIKSLKATIKELIQYPLSKKSMKVYSGFGQKILCMKTNKKTAETLTY